MGDATLISAALLLATLVAVIAIRTRSSRIRIAFEAALILLLSAHLLRRGASPIFIGGKIAGTPEGPWLRAIAVIWWLIAARLVATLTALALGRDDRSRHARLFSDLVAGAVYLTALTIILNSVLGIPIKGLVATSGVIAIVLGLALQNTLADVFSGIATGIEQPFSIGHHIGIAGHAEGVVIETNWRAIRLQTDANDVATIPNSIVARSQIVNHSIPTERRSASLEIPTQSTARSERLMELIRQAILLCPNILEAPSPSISIKALGVRTTTLGVSYHVASTAKLGSARSELLRQTRRLFRHAGITDDGVSTPQSMLSNLALFETLPAEHIDRLARATALHRFQPGDTLMEQGSIGASLFVIESGIFEIHRRREDGSSITHGRVGPGEYLGEVSMMSGDPRAVTVLCMTYGSALELPRAALEALLKQDVSLSAALEKSMQRGLSQLERDDAARVSHPLDANGSILRRIRAFLSTA